MAVKWLLFLLLLFFGCWWVWFSLPVQLIVWKDYSLKWPIERRALFTHSLDSLLHKVSIGLPNRGQISFGQIRLTSQKFRLDFGHRLSGTALQLPSAAVADVERHCRQPRQTTAMYCQLTVRRCMFLHSKWATPVATQIHSPPLIYRLELFFRQILTQYD